MSAKVSTSIPALRDYQEVIVAAVREAFRRFARLVMRNNLPALAALIASLTPEQLGTLRAITDRAVRSAEPVTTSFSDGSDPRRRRLLEHLHALGSRVLDGFLGDLAGQLGLTAADIETLDKLLDEYGRLDSTVLHAVGGDRWPPAPLVAVPTPSARPAPTTPSPPRGPVERAWSGSQSRRVVG